MELRNQNEKVISCQNSSKGTDNHAEPSYLVQRAIGVRDGDDVHVLADGRRWRAELA